MSCRTRLGDALHAADQLARRKRITIRGGIWRRSRSALRGDYGRLRQMFLIVLDNAVKFSRKGDSIEVAMTKDRVIIRDHGVGIAPDLLPFIFDRFQKSRSEQNRQGSGLGLAIAKQIAVRHGIEIDVQSTVGEGTCFSFWITEK